MRRQRRRKKCEHHVDANQSGKPTELQHNHLKEGMVLHRNERERPTPVQKKLKRVKPTGQGESSSRSWSRPAMHEGCIDGRRVSDLSLHTSCSPQAPARGPPTSNHAACVTPHRDSAGFPATKLWKADRHEHVAVALNLPRSSVFTKALLSSSRRLPALMRAGFFHYLAPPFALVVVGSFCAHIFLLCAHILCKASFVL